MSTIKKPSSSSRRTLKSLLALGAMMALMAALPSGAVGAKRMTTETTVFAVPTTPEPPAEAGKAFLTRGDDKIRARYRGQDLEPGVYTLWWILFNNPEACAMPGRCVGSDLRNPEVRTDLGYAGGTVVRSDGRANISAHLREHRDISGFPTVLPPLQSDTGLEDASGTEVHLVLHAHGPKVRGLVGEQLRTFAAGCDHPFGDEYGTPGPNPLSGCVDVQFAVFRATS